MKVEFYFDPYCPFCWVTSRWLLMAAREREIDIVWRPFSLALKNDELGGQNKSSDSDGHRSSHRILRVMLAASRRGGDLGDLYSDFGHAFHLGKRDYDDNLIREILAKADLPTELLDAADDVQYDAALTEEIKSATDVAGEDIGTPTIVFVLEDGTRNGYFGPILQRLPEKSAGLELWDGLSKLAANTDFYELKRSRPAGKPDVGSTAQ